MSIDTRCWICYDENDNSDRWVKPCKCSLTSHEQCLLDWIAETQKNSPHTRAACPQCGSTYFVVETMSTALVVMNRLDRIIQKTVPYITFLGIGCSILVTSTTFGALAVTAFLGSEQSEQLLGPPAQWNWRTWIGMPLIPAILVACNFRWSDGALPFATVLLLRALGSPLNQIKLIWPPSPAAILGLFPWVRLFYNAIFGYLEYRMWYQNTNGGRRHESIISTLNNERHKGLSIINALLWPLISSILGSMLNNFQFIRRYFPEPFHRNTLGGCLYVITKDIASLFYKYERLRQRRSRRVLNHLG
ncbi:hypothetical protein LRAMOSA02705 [Lichtheimia ramosa]|uniref:RING-CH-type domain-containing protein n=1 Tax=Lichtheimia ramosa TaxID=688394 RepID=A0A077WSJ5_9FUNG|nr:hypothetical protein LRAMOSA02705 [Lichtheimia ramosa]